MGQREIIVLQNEELLREGKENMYWGGEEMHRTAAKDKNTKEQIEDVIFKLLEEWADNKERVQNDNRGCD